MYLRELSELDPQLPFAALETNLTTDQFPETNVTKGISEILHMCETAGLNPHGFGCGMSVSSLLINLR
jgi:hypothetical protein